MYFNFFFLVNWFIFDRYQNTSCAVNNVALTESQRVFVSTSKRFLSSTTILYQCCICKVYTITLESSIIPITYFNAVYILYYSNANENVIRCGGHIFNQTAA